MKQISLFLMLISIVSLFFIVINVNGQTNDSFNKRYLEIKNNIGSNEKLTSLHYPDLHLYKENLFIDYILKRETSLDVKKFISNKYFLRMIKTDVLDTIRYYASINLNKLTINIQIESENIMLNEKDSIFLKKDSLNINKQEMISSYYIDSRKLKYQGLSNEVSYFKRIKFALLEVNGKKYNFSSEYFKDLLFPNFNSKLYGVEMLESYLSHDNKYTFIYLFGGSNILRQYFVKLIFDNSDGKYVGRILANNKELTIYKCLRPGFIGF